MADKWLFRLLVITLTGLIIMLMVILISPLFAKDRCIDYVGDVRIQHVRYFGIGFPYWYGIGQLIQESGCRPNITAFDGGKGLTQFMPKTEEYIEDLMGEQLNMYNPEHAIKAQAFYMSRLHKQNPDLDKPLVLTYMSYNSGVGTVKKEYVKAGCPPFCFVNMRVVCKRKIIVLKSGSTLDLCNVGYEYPLKIYNYAKPYKQFESLWKYW